MRKLSHRGIVDITVVRRAIESKDKKVIEQVIKAHRSNFMFSYTEEHYQIHAVDHLALYPLFYTILNDKPYVSQVIDELVPLLPRRVLHPQGYYGIGGLDGGHRTEYSPFDGILRIPPGHYLFYKDGRYELVKYWSFLDLRDKPFEGSYAEACDILGTLIKQGVDRCYAYNPNVAVHLSGGLDSGSVTALLAQSKSDTIHAYAHVKPDAPDDDPILENGYLKKYVSHYPQIALQKSYKLNLRDEFILPVDPLGNWHNVRHDSPEGNICQDLSARKVPIILSGMGGDELASYGHGHQSRGKTIYNNTDARRFMYREIYLKRKMKFLVKGLLGRDGSRVDSIRSSLMIEPFTVKMNFFHPTFRAQVPQLRNKDLISLYWFPSSYAYRIETLQRSYFTIRSDIWNYLSKYYGIDYVFPLLDADLVEFCASIPRAFFIDKQQRQMIKTGLAKYLPQELLGGGKRPGYQPPQGSNPMPDNMSSIQDVIEESHVLVSEMQETLASQVYDLTYISNQLDKNLKIRSKLPTSRFQTRQMVDRKIGSILRLLNRGSKYVNEHFDGIIG